MTAGNHTMSVPVPEVPALPDAVQLGFLLARCVVSVAILAGSSLTVVAVARYKRLRTCPNRVIVSLAVADFLGALLCPALLALHYLRPPHHLWRPLCLAEETLDLIASAGNVMSITLIALDRYVHVVKYLNYQYIVTRRRLTVGVLCVWAYVGLTAAGIVTFGNELREGGAAHGPTCSWTVFTARYVYDYVIVPHVGVVSVFVVVLYARIAYFVYRQRREMLYHRKCRPAAHGQGTGPSGRTLSNSRTNSMIAIVVSAYFAATFPALVISALVISGTPSVTLLLAQQAAILWWYVIAAVNPVIYVWRNPDFQWAFRRLLCISGGEEKDVHDTDVSSTRMTAAAMTSAAQRQ